MKPTVLLLLALGLSCALAGCEDKPNNTGPVVHCFNEQMALDQDVSTGKVSVTCPTGQ